MRTRTELVSMGDFNFDLAFCSAIRWAKP